MQFSVLLALALSAFGVMAAPVQERADSCCGILNGAIRKYTVHYTHALI
jgi:hypothetical protein